MSIFKRPESFNNPHQPATRRARQSFGGFGGTSGNEVFGKWTESIARGMGTPWFLLVLTLFCLAWLMWNTIGPEDWRFDSAALGFTALTLILSLQASYAAPMILLAQNRQDDRDRVQIEQDRQRAERNLADTEFLAREVVALRIALKDLPDRDFVRAELRALLAELEAERDTPAADQSSALHPSLGADISATNDSAKRNSAESDDATDDAVAISDSGAVNSSGSTADGSNTTPAQVDDQGV